MQVQLDDESGEEKKNKEITKETKGHGVSSMEGKTCAAGDSSEAAEVIEEYLVHPQRNRNRSNRHRKSVGRKCDCDRRK